MRNCANEGGKSSERSGVAPRVLFFFFFASNRPLRPDAFAKNWTKKHGTVRPQRGCQEQCICVDDSQKLHECSSVFAWLFCCPFIRQGRSPPPESSIKKKTDACMSEQRKLHIPAQSHAPKLEQTHAITFTQERAHAQSMCANKQSRMHKNAQEKK
jgi:hypothetical protein